MATPVIVDAALSSAVLPEAASYVLFIDAALPESHVASLRDAFSHKPFLERELIAGEPLKTVAEFLSVVEWMAQHQVHSQTVLVAVGGGTVLDFVGFVASVYHRGTPYVSVPTTTLAMIDAAIGGKTALNLPQGKNLIGSFYEPIAIVYDFRSLASLPQREKNAGLAEAVKIALACDGDFFEWLWAHQTTLATTHLSELIVRSRALKQKVVSSDFYDQGARQKLNLGHTFGHAIEAALGFEGLMHGEAVAIGVCMAAKLSAERGMISGEDVQRIETLFQTLQLPTSLPEGITLDTLIPFMQQDKKNKGHPLTLILLNSIGCATQAYQ